MLQIVMLYGNIWFYLLCDDVMCHTPFQISVAYKHTRENYFESDGLFSSSSFHCASICCDDECIYG